MSKANISLGAERKLLSALSCRPNEIFDIDGNAITESDLSNPVTQVIYVAIREIAQELKSNKPSEIDAIVLEERIAAKFPKVYESQKGEFHSCIKAIKESPPPTDIVEYVRIIATDSVKRKSKQRLSEIATEVDKMSSPDKVVAHIEQSVAEFTAQVTQKADVANIAVGYDDYLASLAEEIRTQGKITIGVSTGLPTLDLVLGGGLRRGTITTLAARAGLGKSLLGAHCAINLAIDQKVPVLYLDTELNRQIMMNRIIANRSRISIHDVEHGKFLSDNNLFEKIKITKDEFANNTFDYVSIKGWGIREQISVIRRWITKCVGRQRDGQFRHAVVVLDYIKLMSEEDKGDNKEWETLGYRMTSLHNLMAQYEVSMLMFAQQNRQGIDRYDEGTVSGSDRIIWLCDAFGVLFKVPVTNDPAEANAQSDTDGKYANMGLRISKCRHGRGTPPNRFVSLYCDKEDPRIKESEVTGRFYDKGMRIVPTV